ncbi:hypothetical protein BN1708_020062, partial [Verticillium longisporum]
PRAQPARHNRDADLVLPTHCLEAPSPRRRGRAGRRKLGPRRQAPAREPRRWPRRRRLRAPLRPPTRLGRRVHHCRRAREAGPRRHSRHSLLRRRRRPAKRPVP